jgi:GAF domain-containing protein
VKRPAKPENETDRIAALRALLVLDTEPEEQFDAMTAYCTSRFGVEIALVTLIDVDRQWFKSACGLAGRETTRDESFCGHAILEDSVMVVPDARTDERFHDNPSVIGPPHIRFYAGAPLTLSSGHRVGTLCLVDARPRRLEGDDLAHLRELAAVVARELENRAGLLTGKAGQA